MARPKAPDSSHTSTSTVGLPRESRISRAWRERISDRGLGLSLEDEPRESAQRLGRRAEGRESVEGLADQPAGLGLRGLDAVNGGIGGLLLRLVLPRRLAELLRRAGDVENVVHDLEGEAEIAARDGEGSELLVPGATQARADADRRADERGRLVEVDVFEHVGTDAPSL